MRHFYIRKAGILLTQCGFVAAGLFAIWLLGGIAETPALWWLYALAAFGSFCFSCLLLALALLAEDNLRADMARAKQVPIRKIDRRHSA